jgi:type IV secretory pathway component VirB8
MSRLSCEQKREIQFKILNHLIAKEKVKINPSAAYIKQLTTAQQVNHLIEPSNARKFNCRLICAATILFFISMIFIFLFLKTFDEFSISILKNKKQIGITFNFE